MITLLIVFGLIYFACWLLFTILGFVFKIAFFPLKVILGIVMGVIAFAILSPIALLFIVPVLLVLLFIIMGKYLCKGV